MRTVRRTGLWLLVFVPALLPAGCLLLDSVTMFKGSEETSTDRWQISGGLSHNRRTITEITFSSDGSHILTGGARRCVHYDDGMYSHGDFGSSEISLWSYGENRSNFRTAGGGIARTRFSPDGSLFAYTTGKESEVRDLETGSLRWRIENPQGSAERMMCDVSPDCRLVAWEIDDKIVVKNLKTRQNELTLPATGQMQILMLTFSPDGRYLLSEARKKTEEGRWEELLILWNLKTKSRAWQIPSGTRHWMSFARFSPDGRLISASYTDGVQNADSDEELNCVRIWDTDTGKLVTELKTPGKIAWSTAFSPDGKRLAMGFEQDLENTYERAEIAVWDTATWREIESWKVAGAWGITAVTFSPDGGTLAVGTSSGDTFLYLDQNREPEQNRQIDLADESSG